MSRNRIPIIGNSQRHEIQFIIGLIALAALALVGFAQTAHGQVVLPYYVADGYTTENVFVNVTDAKIELPGDGLIYGCMCPKPAIAAHSFASFPSKRTGVGVETFTLPEGVEAYAEITTPHGVPVRIGGLQPNTTSYVMNVTRAGEYNGGVFVAAETDSVVQIVGGEAFRLRAGEGRIATAPFATTVVTNTWGTVGAPGIISGRLYVFGFVNHWKTGAVLIVPAR